MTVYYVRYEEQGNRWWLGDKSWCDSLRDARWFAVEADAEQEARGARIRVGFGKIKVVRGFIGVREQ